MCTVSGLRLPAFSLHDVYPCGTLQTHASTCRAAQAQALELICRCDDVSDEAVELRLLKAMLTAVTSSTLSVHGQALLLVGAVGN
jgi:hypothetical protein